MYTDPTLEPGGMDPLINGAMERASQLISTNTEGRRRVGLNPMVQIVIRGTTNVIISSGPFSSTSDLVQSCMNAIKAAEETRARAVGYILATPSDSLSPVDMPVPIPVPSIIIVGVDRQSWGKVIVSHISRENDLLTITGVDEFDGKGMFAGTMYDPWSANE